MARAGVGDLIKNMIGILIDHVYHLFLFFRRSTGMPNSLSILFVTNETADAVITLSKGDDEYGANDRTDEGVVRQGPHRGAFHGKH